MIPNKITREHLILAADLIDREGIPKMRQSTRYNVLVDGKKYPPKYLIAVASKLATGKMISSQTYNGGMESNTFLRARGFTITDKYGKVVRKP